MGTVAARPGTAPLVCRHDLRGGHRPHCHELAEVQTYCCAMPFRGHDVHRDGFTAPWLSRSRRDDPGGVRPVGVRGLQVRSFKYLVAIFALYFVFTLLAMSVYLLQKVPPAVTEFGCYTLFNVLMFAAFVACATECNTTIVDPEYPVCKRATGAKAALAFSFLTWAATCVSMLFTFKEWRDAGYESMPGIPSNFDYMPGRGNAATTQTFA